jgi:2-keto-4-pentenoate hydratase
MATQLSEAAVTKAAALLIGHRRDGSTLQNLPDMIRPATRADGYRIQAAVERLRDQPIFGWKIAATSKAGQAHIRVDGPLAGSILGDQALRPGVICRWGANRMRVAELEFAFRFARDLPPRDRPYVQHEVLDAVASLHLAIEIPDSRFDPFEQAGAPQLIADNACSNYLLVGDPVEADWHRIDLAVHEVRGRIDGGAWQPGIGSNVLGDPRIALTWLVNEISAHGIAAKAGQAVTTGTCLPPMAIRPGSHVEGDFGLLGTIALTIDQA